MRSVTTAIAWEFWSANRRGWLLLLAAIPTCALLYRIFAGLLNENDVLQTFGYLPFGVSLIVAIALCNYTDRTRRDDAAGFPRHLFVRPASTRLIVAAAMGCSVLSVVGVYVAWVKLILAPTGLPIILWWPATLLAAGVVFYQAILWCLSNFRLTRIVCLSVMAPALIAVSFLPYQKSNTGAVVVEMSLAAVLGTLAFAAYGMTVVSVGAQRCGGARKLIWGTALVEVIQNAIPKRRWKLATSNAALLWIEWRRSGVLLPIAVVLTIGLILGPVMWLTGRGEEATMRAAAWLAILPMILAFPIGIGFGKQDIWSLELSLPSFVTSRPVSCGQLVAAKLKSAALSALLAWAVLLLVAPVAIFLTCDTEHVRGAWRMFCTLYSPSSRALILPLCLLAAMAMTWSLMVGTLWIGYAGRPAPYYAFACVGVAGLVAALICVVWWTDNPHKRDEVFVSALPWIPWLLAGVVTVKLWVAAIVVMRARACRLVTDRQFVQYVGLWLTITACLVLAAMLISPQILWFRHFLILGALCAFPAACMAAAPLAVARNRHR